MSEPVELMTLRAQLAHALGLYRASVEAELAALRVLAEPYAQAIGEVGPSEALAGWREAAIRALARRLS